MKSDNSLEKSFRFLVSIVCHVKNGTEQDKSVYFQSLQN